MMTLRDQRAMMVLVGCVGMMLFCLDPMMGHHRRALFLDPGKYVDLEGYLFKECLGVAGACRNVHAHPP